MHGSPADERPGRAVPKSGQEKDDPRIPEKLAERDATPPERDVNVVLKPRGERDVPASPEIRKGRRKVGTVKVEHRAEAKRHRQTACAVRISREIAVNLQGEEDCAQQTGNTRIERGSIEDVIHIERERIRHNHLLEESATEKADSLHRDAKLEASRLEELG